ncbi:hypothetical protein [Kibdelosporangium aridum]|uniref:Uncharacterized protein n=1 Tax=Kibdelosporangium aridum TaxID=2030 RepID=A0A1W2DNI2_KIBAR|nr:hypothetical protein [Kibdelosporangium aridum]SMC98632.1 hypothetical protein SAMN05661093_03562 [Kibdelosporangium aridum]
MSSDNQEQVVTRRPSHALPDDAEGPHPLVDLSRDPHPGIADHAKPDEED